MDRLENKLKIPWLPRVLAATLYFSEYPKEISCHPPTMQRMFLFYHQFRKDRALCFLEAQACGKPVVAFGIGGAKEAVGAVRRVFYWNWATERA